MNWKLQQECFRDVAGRMIRNEANAARRNAKRGCDGFTEWIDRYYDDHILTFCDAVGPSCQALAAATGKDPMDHARALACDHITRSRNELSKVVRAATDTNLTDMIDSLVGGWTSLRADAFADAAIGADDA